jgi:DNA-binding MarR family transcriptional regulator
MARLESGPMTTADLARAESMKPQSMGAALAQMEEDGLVRRRAHPTDGRQILFELTPAGAARRSQTRLAKRAWLLAAVGKLSAREQQMLFAATDVIRRVAET